MIAYPRSVDASAAKGCTRGTEKVKTMKRKSRILWAILAAFAAMSLVKCRVAREGYTAALLHDGTVWAWGSNAAGQLGDGSAANRASPVRVADLTDVVAIAAGGAHFIALKNDGTVWAWGSNAVGQLGDGTKNDRFAPVQVSGLSGVTAIAAGGRPLMHNLRRYVHRLSAAVPVRTAILRRSAKSLPAASARPRSSG